MWRAAQPYPSPSLFLSPNHPHIRAHSPSPGSVTPLSPPNPLIPPPPSQGPYHLLPGAVLYCEVLLGKSLSRELLTLLAYCSSQSQPTQGLTAYCSHRVDTRGGVNDWTPPPPPPSRHNVTHKPIFHCNAKPFALGPGIGLDPQSHNFALGIPICWYLKTLKFALPPSPSPNAKHQREPMEYRLRWVPNVKLSRWPCTFHFVCAHFVCVGYPTRTQLCVSVVIKRYPFTSM